MSTKELQVDPPDAETTTLSLLERLEAHATELARASASCRAEQGEAPVDVTETPFDCEDCQTNAVTIGLLREVIQDAQLMRSLFNVEKARADALEAAQSSPVPAHSAIASSLTAVIHQLRKHQASHQSWLDHYVADPDHTCGRCTPEVLAGVGDAVEQEVTVKVYEGLIQRIQAAQNALRESSPVPAHRWEDDKVTRQSSPCPTCGAGSPRENPDSKGSQL